MFFANICFSMKHVFNDFTEKHYDPNHFSILSKSKSLKRHGWSSFSSIFNRSWSPKKTTWGTCPTRTGASWASFIAGFGRRCCGTINGVASCWMDFRMSPSEMRLGLQPGLVGRWWMLVIWCPHRSLNPHEVVGFLPLLDKPRINLSFSRKTHRKAGVCRKTVESLRVFFFETLKLGTPGKPVWRYIMVHPINL